MPSVDASRNLLFGLLALQNSFIDRDALLDAFNRWAHDKVRLLGEILVERGPLAPDEFALLDALVAKHIEKFENDPQRSLAALSSIGSTSDQSLAERRALLPLTQSARNTSRVRSGAGFRLTTARLLGSLGDPLFLARLVKLIGSFQVHPHDG
jgi:hypothetical protein